MQTRLLWRRSATALGLYGSVALGFLASIVAARRLGPDKADRQVTIYLTAYEPDQPEAIQELLRDAIADYVWLTPLSAHGPPRRCK